MQSNTTVPSASSHRADLIILEDGRVVAVVESKGVPIPPALLRPVTEQVRHYAQTSGSRWVLLVDPVLLRI